jgi:hypothetical protein
MFERPVEEQEACSKYFFWKGKAYHNIGYSIPATDLRFKSLLATGFQDNGSFREIFFVSPDLKEDPSRKDMEHRL